MAYLAVRKVTYDGRDYKYISPRLEDGVNILEGDNGTGKSTFASLIYFGLGGRVGHFMAEHADRHIEITGDADNSVELEIEIDGLPYAIKRFVGTNDIAVLGDNESSILPLIRRGDEITFSDWMLRKLSIEPVAIHVGTYSGIVNFTDLMRLMYHDQAADPSRVFKSIDNNSYVTDSRAFREAIFEILVGKSFQEYYIAHAAFKDAERSKLAAAKALELFKDIALSSAMVGDSNVVFLERQESELREQEARLLNYRRELTKAPPSRTEVNVSGLQQDLLANEVVISDSSRREAELLDEMSRLERLREELIAEATQLQKMMFAHESLKLFSGNTCPYCLREVSRVPNHCICGNVVNEGEYEKFFYDSADYLAILKSRQKNVSTIERAKSAVLSELERARKQRRELESNSEAIKAAITAVVGNSASMIDLNAFEEVETSLGAVRESIGKIQQQRQLELRRDELERQLNASSANFSSSKAKAEELAAAAYADMQKKRAAFSAIYNRMMMQTLADCRSAAIGDNYMPEVNGGEYTEASAAVPRRLLYYATMLEMSLVDDSVKFPRFLLVDTPETLGIDADNLRNALTRLFEVVEKGNSLGKACQVILTTGIGKRPGNVAFQVIGHMVKGGDKLLIRKA